MIRAILRACALVLVLPLALSAQTPISNIVNSYAAVTKLGSNYAVAPGSVAFTVDDTVLLIQMKGATIDTSNTPAFGTVTAYNGAGNFEFLIIQCRSADTLFFTSALSKTYEASGRVQVVRVPHYTDAVVQDSLTAAPWNGSVGGVVAVSVAGILTLNGPVTASGKGFRGGSVSNNPDGSCGDGYSAYHYPIAQGVGAEKGEGIGTVPSGKEAGRGAPANGGGGGNKHNTGGGGGGNFSAGGSGGNTMTGCSPAAVGGIGGRGLGAAGKIFMGGGGGCSDNNNYVGTVGTAGGGIIVIRAGSLVGNGKTVRTNGLDQGYIINNIGDGAGGAGAGGSVLLQVGSYGGTSLTVQANGGHGGDQHTDYGGYFGPGGGGGVGVIWVNGTALPGTVAASTQPGTSGKIIGPPGAQLLGQPYGATDGQPANGLQYGLALTLPPPATPTAPLVIGDSTQPCRTVKFWVTGGSTGAQYTWSFGDGTTGTGNPITHQYPQAGAYTATLSASGALPCVASLSRTVTISGPSLFPVITDSVIHCKKLKLWASAAGVADGYQWFFGDGTSSTANPAVHTYAQLGPHTVTLVAADGAGCFDTVRRTISLPYDPGITAGADTAICPGDRATLIAGGGVQYTWSPVAGMSGATTGIASVVPPIPSTYWVTGYDTLGCPGTDSVWVDFLAPPVIYATANDRPVTCQKPSVQLFASGGLSYQWEPARWCDDPGAANPIVTPPRTTVFSVTGVDARGCHGTGTVEVVSLVDVQVFMPDAFSPNSDGRNETIKPTMQCGCEFSSFRVYNRWGQQLFVSYRYREGWDGRYDGALQETGTYQYLIHCNKADGKGTAIMKGNFTLVR